MLHEFSRMEMLVGAKALEKLKNSKVAIFGIGGVGSFAVEALTRAGLGSLVLIDDDVICLSNLNRQLHATHITIGRPKVEVMKERILSINPYAEVTTCEKFYTAESSQELLQEDYDYVIDAVDTVSAKIHLVVRCQELGIPIISSMGAGNKMDPTKFQVSDIYSTSVDPLAKIMRRELRKRGIGGLKVVYSTEVPVIPLVTYLELVKEEHSGTGDLNKRRIIPGSVSFVPSVAGLILGGEVIRDLISWKL
ncbi:MAG TPA: tRNA cyclic N6-threonylcarbamoyladenosine(37) synthase TcdA [Clostridiales bacterium]|nr:tRNA threonylcarbamoyladenosine dehydratase [Clostridia bacterium]HCS73894.1 tRNA cyclic N6-threonylcarbamoyladenosine(37) synthase TcdA [Clostridiales bacterium]